MVAMFRAMYGLPYLIRDLKIDRLANEDLVEHAQVYVVAEKYQVPALKDAVKKNLKYILAVNGGKTHLIEALRIMFTEIGDEKDKVRDMLVSHCARKFSTLSKDESFKALLVELPEIATAIITHWNYDIGTWVCDGKASCQGVPKCPECGFNFLESDAWENRNEELWYCYCHGECDCYESTHFAPVCSGCGNAISWRSQRDSK